LGEKKPKKKAHPIKIQGEVKKFRFFGVGKKNKFFVKIFQTLWPKTPPQGKGGKKREKKKGFFRVF